MSDNIIRHSIFFLILRDERYCKQYITVNKSKFHHSKEIVSLKIAIIYIYRKCDISPRRLYACIQQ